MASAAPKEGLEINVTGSGYVVHAADRAILVLQAQSRQLPSPAEASAAVTSTANVLREAILPHCYQDNTAGHAMGGAAISHYSMSTLDTSNHQQRPDKDGNMFPTTYSARVEFHIKFSDFDVLNTLATKFSAMENIKIQKINWCLTDDTLNGIRGSARKLAAQDAIQRGWDYAEVFARVPAEDLAKKVVATSVKEETYYSQSTRPQLHYGKKLRMEGTHPQGREELQFQPEDVRLEAKVSARFIVGV
ncbi:uncharacterized protein BDR25DRAFT_50156 [Lindgomyces ingoldianus]|uniref:Uncharacterized protein n=1 Tax=Lindgomyces ingoldianus TaxID=673940 RepID=A0ACB6QTL5_9PLEO|nr:uncharacterized protein BDR25DRAFT_50156 [Lindgomyces ingoldianus]KAF2469506.1 hypothetical protein BDR25DRAFT_50156 [Lindgomyces ingoldianus]